MYHIYETQQFTEDYLRAVFERAKHMQTVFKEGGNNSLARINAVNWFGQPSTRTHGSFRVAELNLGIRILFDTDSASETSSAIKGETYEDTVRILSGWVPDPRSLVIVLRHEDGKAAERFVEAAGQSGPHIVNAGCGKRDGQHPTQSLLDLFTIQKERPHLEEPVIVIVGDCRNGRTARSLCYLAPKLYPGLKIVFVSPPSLMMMDDIKKHLTEHQVHYEEVTDSGMFSDVLRQANVVYMTRIQKEDLTGDDVARFEDYQTAFQLNSNTIKALPDDGLILHPLPRNLEIAQEIDSDPRAAYSDPRAAYFRQADNGVFVRMALLRMMFP